MSEKRFPGWRIKTVRIIKKIAFFIIDTILTE